MLNEVIVLGLLLCKILIDIIFFCAGGIVFILLLSAPSAIKNMNDNPFRVYTVCTFIVWCWLYGYIVK